MDKQLIEDLSKAAHEGWMEGKKGQGIASRKAEDGEELMVPYGDLSEKAKDLDRSNISSVMKAIDRAGYKLVKK